MEESGETALRRHRLADLAVLATLALFVVIYLLDAVRSSIAFLHLILVLPLSLAILLLCAVAFVRRFRVPRRAPRPEDGVPEGTAGAGIVIGLFAGYVAALGWLGFDVGTALFIGVFLYLHGERRWPWLIGYSIALGFGLALAFSSLLPYAMPMLLLSAGQG